MTDIKHDNTSVCGYGKNHSAICSANLLHKDADLASVVEAWSVLPLHIKEAIRALINTVFKGQDNTKSSK
ncbi:MAG: hypothetical protein JW828_10440 [Sedimentisphaerales bacterium]|nr:hypothetical protein [Sedimentisphaerales bacterium]